MMETERQVANGGKKGEQFSTVVAAHQINIHHKMCKTIWFIDTLERRWRDNNETQSTTLSIAGD